MAGIDAQSVLHLCVSYTFILFINPSFIVRCCNWAIILFFFLLSLSLFLRLIKPCGMTTVS